MSKQVEGMSDQTTGLKTKNFLDLNGKTREIPNGQYEDYPIRDSGDNPSGFTATAMSKVSCEDWQNPIEVSKFSPKRKCD